MVYTRDEMGLPHYFHRVPERACVWCVGLLRRAWDTSRRGIWDIDRSLVRNKSIGPLHSAGNGHASLLTNINVKARNRKVRLVTSDCGHSRPGHRSWFALRVNELFTRGIDTLQPKLER